MTSITGITTHFLADLPEELSQNILSNLNVQELGQFSLVCHEANRIAGEDKLWEKVVSGPSHNIKAFAASRAVRSVGEISLFIQEFIRNIQLDTKGSFMCEFPFNPEYHVSIGYKSGTIAPDIVANSKEIATNPDFTLACYYMTREGGDAPLGLDIQGGPAQSFIVITKLKLPQNQTQNMELARQIGNNVRERLEYLKDRSFFNRVLDAVDTLCTNPTFVKIENAITVTITVVALSVIAAYAVKRFRDHD